MVKFVIGVLVGIGLVVLASYLFVKGGGIFMGTDTKPLPLGETIAGAAVYGVGRKVRSQKSEVRSQKSEVILVPLACCSRFAVGSVRVAHRATATFALSVAIRIPGTGRRGDLAARNISPSRTFCRSRSSGQSRIVP